MFGFWFVFFWNFKHCSSNYWWVRFLQNLNSPWLQFCEFSFVCFQIKPQKRRDRALIKFCYGFLSLKLSEGVKGNLEHFLFFFLYWLSCFLRKFSLPVSILVYLIRQIMENMWISLSFTELQSWRDLCNPSVLMSTRRRYWCCLKGVWASIFTVIANGCWQTLGLCINTE